jgi:hypothetical protein
MLVIVHLLGSYVADLFKSRHRLEIKCGREQSCTVSHNHTVRHMPDPKAA